LKAATALWPAGGAPVKDAKNIKVLVVEDNFMNKILIKEMLTLNGYEVLEASTGKEAVAMAGKERPDIVFMDIHLPEMDGFEATRLIKGNAETKDIPVVALTASAMRGDEERILKEGFDGYVPKPVERKRLLEIIEKLLTR